MNLPPKEKAEYLINKYLNTQVYVSYLDADGDRAWVYGKMSNTDAINFAIKEVEEIIAQWEYIDTFISNYGGELNPNLRYCQQVKQHIEEYGK